MKRSSCIIKEGIRSSCRYLPTYLPDCFDMQFCDITIWVIDVDISPLPCLFVLPGPSECLFILGSYIF